MRTMIFIGALVTTVSGCLFAEGPLYKHEDKYTNQEFVNVYQDIRNAGTTLDPLTISSATISSATINSLQVVAGTITVLNASSITVTTSLIAPTMFVQRSTGTDSTYTSASGTSYADTGLSRTFTPRYSNSIIKITVSQTVGTETAAGTIKYRLLRDAVTVWEGVAIYQNNFPGAYLTQNRQNIVWYDQPNTTSQVTYKTQCGNRVGSFPWLTEGDGSFTDMSTITVEEIKQ